MRVLVKKWGNSAAVRLPRGVMDAARLNIHEPVEIREQDGRIIIEPIRAGKPDLALLLSGITAENMHGEMDFGAPVGKEIL